MRALAAEPKRRKRDLSPDNFFSRAERALHFHRDTPTRDPRVPPGLAPHRPGRLPPPDTRNNTLHSPLARMVRTRKEAPSDRSPVCGWKLRLIHEAQETNTLADTQSGGFALQFLPQRTFTRVNEQRARKIGACKGAQEVRRTLPRLELSTEEDNGGFGVGTP